MSALTIEERHSDSHERGDAICRGMFSTRKGQICKNENARYLCARSDSPQAASHPLFEETGTGDEAGKKQLPPIHGTRTGKGDGKDLRESNLSK